MDYYKIKKMQYFKEEVVAFFSKFYVWGLYVFIGLIAHISHILAAKEKPSRLQFFGSMGTALFVGYLASAWCIANAPEKGKYLVPVATLLSEKILSWILTNWKKLLNLVLNLNNNEEDKSNNSDTISPSSEN